jgi:hypothetical protein
VPIALHLHNDIGLATANAIAGSRPGRPRDDHGQRHRRACRERAAGAVRGGAEVPLRMDIGIDCTKMKALSDHICQCPACTSRGTSRWSARTCSLTSPGSMWPRSSTVPDLRVHPARGGRQRETHHHGKKTG